MMNREAYNIEFKREITKTFLKTVSAFANYNDGEIFFGIEDDGNIVGIENTKENCMRIENMINDSMYPVPEFKMEIIAQNNKNIIVLKIKKGNSVPYYCQGKAYKRSDTATKEVDHAELNRLVLRGQNIEFEKLKSSIQDPTFNLLEKYFKEKAGIKKMTLDILKTLNLYDKNGFYNIAGELFSDNNSISFSGTDIMKFGKNINIILFRERLENVSLLFQYEKALEIFEKNYIYEEIRGFERSKYEMIPKEAFREALANALIHRVWDINSNIRIAMYEDKIEIISPGGLPYGMEKDEYFRGNISVLRNPIIAGIFYRLNIIEQFGTGVARIKNEYEKSIVKPEFIIGENSIKIILPVMQTEINNLTKGEKEIYSILKKIEKASRSELEKQSGFNKAKTIRLLNTLLEKRIIIFEGNGRGRIYRLKK